MILKLKNHEGWRWIDRVAEVDAKGDKTRQGVKAPPDGEDHGSHKSVLKQLEERHLIQGEVTFYGTLRRSGHPLPNGEDVFVQVVRYKRDGRWYTAVLHEGGWLLNDQGDTISALA